MGVDFPEVLKLYSSVICASALLSLTSGLTLISSSSQFKRKTKSSSMVGTMEIYWGQGERLRNTKSLSQEW